jgi:hypothetical protein
MTAQPGDSGQLAEDEVRDLDEGELDDDAAEDELTAQADETARTPAADVIVAEVVDVAPSLEPDGAAPATQQDGQPEPGLAAEAVQHSQQWHAIQAMFVDDPGGAVRLAAEAAETAVRAVVSALDREQTWMHKPDDVQGDAPDTEQLRTTLREFRAFSERMDRLAGQRAGAGLDR